MPFGTGGGGIHDDGYHTGNAKRDTASGVKGIDAGLNLTPKAVMADIDAAILNVANGIAGLDASALIPAAQIPGIVARKTTGIFTGNGTQNRAIAHGLGATPNAVIMKQRGADYAICLMISEMTEWIVVNDAGKAEVTVTAADATNFYVGSATGLTNINTYPYKWMAIL